ncbi:hypothetical protein A5621_13370 [Mycobacterium colombiense]|uniref:hypothetical protein n=1 Tax=Mycobacterium colombiense TaxID=339268 RepID=UPI0007FF017A|nr:hypothetical protein [Mycobacterium colombiense]OBJ38352.1 hypothetical protein A5621_13370 [Mycobacterium colombiense]
MKKALRSGAVAACAMIALSAVAVVTGPTTVAEPASDDDLIRPLPAVAVKPTNWVPKFPFPYDQTRGSVTDADISAEREMCQWYNAQYEILEDQIERLQFNRLQQNGPGTRVGSATDWDYSFGPIQHQVDIVTANIDQSIDFLAPRAQALTQSQDFAGDIKFPLYQGESFYRLWQHLSNVNAGIKAHQPDWFTGPSVQRFKLWGSRINRSHVCR